MGLSKITGWCDAHFIADWRTEWRRLWSIRVAAFWSFVGALVALLPLISDEAKAILGPWSFAAIFVAAFVSWTLARYLKQPGTSDDA